MVHHRVEEILQENRDEKIIYKSDTNSYHELENIKYGIDDSHLYKIDKLRSDENFNESCKD